MGKACNLWVTQAAAQPASRSISRSSGGGEGSGRAGRCRSQSPVQIDPSSQARLGMQLRQLKVPLPSGPPRWGDAPQWGLGGSLSLEGEERSMGSLVQCNYGVAV
jgi:hypothetical protein